MTRIRIFINPDGILPLVYRRYDSKREMAEAMGVPYWTLYNVLRMKQGVSHTMQDRIRNALPRATWDEMFQVTTTAR